MDVLKEGQIGGKCQFNESLLKAEPLHLSPLQSWAPEIQHFKEQLNQISQDSAVCDIFIEKPTFIIKIDASKFLSNFESERVLIDDLFSSCQHVPPLLRLFQFICFAACKWNS